MGKEHETAKQAAEDHEETSKQSQDGMGEMTRDIWLAGLGLLSSVEEEGSKVYDKFLERGRRLVERGRKYERGERISELSDMLSAAAKAVEQKVSDLVEPLDITGRKELKELKELNAKVDKLADSIDAITRELDKQAGSRGKK